jgi:hypothetical protein
MMVAQMLKLKKLIKLQKGKKVKMANIVQVAR